MDNKALWVSREVLSHNLSVIRRAIEPHTRLLVNLKADAYGLGAVHTGLFLQDEADYFSVAQAGEGMELRKAGIQTPIMVYNPPVEPEEVFFDARLEPVLYHPAQARIYHDMVRRLGLECYPVHIQLNTGMNRSGASEEDMNDLRDFLVKQNRLKPVSVFSHLASADDPVDDAFSWRQIRLFDTWSDVWKHHFPEIMRHLANTAGIFRFPTAHYDMVRPGLSVYGFHTMSDRHPPLRSAVLFRARLTQIRMLRPGDSVGYNRTFVADKPMRVGLVPVGYADGIRRRLSNGKIAFRCGAFRCPVLGRVSMDTTVIDLTEVPVHTGDWVEVFGRGTSVYDWAERLQTIPYEILTSVSSRVPRIFVDKMSEGTGFDI